MSCNIIVTPMADINVRATQCTSCKDVTYHAYRSKVTQVGISILQSTFVALPNPSKFLNPLLTEVIHPPFFLGRRSQSCFLTHGKLYQNEDSD